MTERYWIPTTIKAKWFNKILSGEKTIERKVASNHWKPRLEKAKLIKANGGKVGISFLCGQTSTKYEVLKIISCHSNIGWEVDGVRTSDWYEIHLGDPI
jgi:hypothetical protein